MRKLIISIFLFSFSLICAQNKNVSFSLKAGFGLNAGHSVIYTPNLKLGADFQTKNNDLYFYLSYNFMRQSLYSGHYLGLAIENHFLSKEKRFRPYFGLSFMSEVTSNYKEGFLSAAIDNETSFSPRDGHVHYPIFSGQSSSYMFNSSGFYYSTPFFGTASVGFDVRLIKYLHLSFSLGYGMQLMRYKYLEWKNDADYRGLLKDIPMESKMLHYVNAELGLRYEFSFGNKPKPQ